MDSPIARRLAQAVALGRIGIGATALVAPTLMTRPWIGDAAGAPPPGCWPGPWVAATWPSASAPCGRSASTTPRRGPWVALAGMADAVDAVVTVAAFRRLPGRPGGRSWPPPPAPPWCPSGWPLALEPQPQPGPQPRPETGPTTISSGTADPGGDLDAPAG